MKGSMEDISTIPAPRTTRLQWFEDSHGAFGVFQGKKSYLRWYGINSIDGTRQVWFADEYLGVARTHLEAEALLSLFLNELLLELGDL